MGAHPLVLCLHFIFKSHMEACFTGEEDAQNAASKSPVFSLGTGCDYLFFMYLFVYFGHGTHRPFTDLEGEAPVPSLSSRKDDLVLLLLQWETILRLYPLHGSDKCHQDVFHIGFLQAYQ